MIIAIARLKFIAIILIASLLSCGPGLFNVKKAKSKILSAEQAKTIDWQKKTVKLWDIHGEEYWLFITGWNEEGFILKRHNRVDILPYAELQNRIEIETDEPNTAKGARFGLYAGLISSVLFFFVGKSMTNDDKSDVSSDTSLFLYIASTMMILSVGTGIALGSMSHKFDKYYYDKEEFKSQPFSVNSDDSTAVFYDGHRGGGAFWK